MKFVKFRMVNVEICSRCGRFYDGSYCSCMENDR